MYPGKFTLCLKTLNLDAMRRFYESLGMTSRVLRTDSVLVSNGDVQLALMTFLDQHCMNFRGADPFEHYQSAVDTGIEFDGTPEAYRKEQNDADADGSCWTTTDPDGNNVFIDTNENETGEAGHLHYLLRIIDDTRRQLVNIEAPQACRELFEAEIVNRFITPERITSVGFDLAPLPAPGLFPGHFNYCLKSADPELSRNWYQALGLAVGTPSEGPFVLMRSADCALSLMSFLGENWLNFRGADVFRIYDQMAAAGLELEGEPARYTAEEFGDPGAHWQTQDPDGNVVYFDTTDDELIKPGDIDRARGILERACEQLDATGADDSCIGAIRASVLARIS